MVRAVGLASLGFFGLAGFCFGLVNALDSTWPQS
jgi:hypothetical protein